MIKTTNLLEHDVKKLGITWFESPFADGIEATVLITWVLKDKKLRMIQKQYFGLLVLNIINIFKPNLKKSMPTVIMLVIGYDQSVLCTSKW